MVVILSEAKNLNGLPPATPDNPVLPGLGLNT